MIRALLLLVFLFVSSSAALAHSTSRAFVRLSEVEGALRLDLALSILDLETALGVDSDGNGLVTWRELSDLHPEIESYVRRGVVLSRGEPCDWGETMLLVEKLSDGAYAVLRAPIRCGSSGDLRIDYNLFFDVDAQHRAYGNVRVGGKLHLPLFDSVRRTAALDVSSGSAAARSGSVFGEYFFQGVLHIWEGYDHILFLLALLLPSVVERRSGHRSTLGAVTLDVVKVVTAFTIAHSITLALASLGVVRLPSWVVESVIAASVFLAAQNNIFPFVRDGRWGIAFVFGLLHGFGFASVLADVGLPESSLFVPLLAFNVGVEAGQLAIVLAFVPIAFAMRDTWIYRKIVLLGGSALIAMLSAIWLVERLAGISIIS